MKKPSEEAQKPPVYDHKRIEPKWQKAWDKQKLYRAIDPKGAAAPREKFYALIEFPYPSGDGLHVGHIRSNTAMDIIARKRRREGYEVLYPIGWDAFGLPTENYAIKTGIQPAIVTKKNTDIFRRQLKALGFSFDWSREIDTTDPAYYKWTQWIFLQFLKKGLAYKKKMAINWCPKDLIGLANEEVIDGCCERCGTPVEKREKEQWMLAITKYADRLDKDLDKTEFLEKIKVQQRNWIGRSEGAEIGFKIQDTRYKKEITVFTTRPDTLYGVTYIVLAPEHPLVSELLDHESCILNRDEARSYISDVKKKTDIERTDISKEKTGIELKGFKAINPATGKEIPVWIADYVLADYGTGAVMAVPAHDERDFVFAKKYGLPMRDVIQSLSVQTAGPDAVQKDKPFVERDAALCIIKHWSEDKYLMSFYKANDWKGFIVGGIEDGESLGAAGAREIHEETGYKNAKFVKRIGTIHSQFHHQVKGVNRFAHFQIAYFELENGERDEMSEEEKKLHDVVWVSADQVAETANRADIVRAWEYFRGQNCYTGDGLLIDSDGFSGKRSDEIKKEIAESVGGRWVTTYKLRDWVFSRQRYWGEPIPVIHCETCGIVPVPEKDLPVKLPKVKDYKPTETGESPLAAISKWVNTKCPTCKGKATRETDTMPNWAGSSWYYLAYIMRGVSNFQFPISKYREAFDYWTPVDWYNGGMEHTTLHLLYSRFWHKFLYDLGLVPTDEPYKKRTSHGLILAEGGVKMSKSKGNVINPDDIVEKVGADALRIYEMFMGPFDQPIAWNADNISGARRFIERVWKLIERVMFTELDSTEYRVPSTESRAVDDMLGTRNPELITRTLHKTIKKVSEDIEAMRFNTAVSSLMIALNELEKQESIAHSDYEIFLRLLAPFAPHVTEELWSSLGNKKSIHVSEWPTYNPALVIDAETTIIVQVNGKVRASFVADAEASDADLETTAKDLPEVKKWLEGKGIKKVIVVPKKLVNIVVD